MLFPRPFAWDGLGSMRLGFAGINGELYVPVGPDRKPLPGRKFPVVLWMHEYSYATGYSRFSASPIAMLVAAGFAVLAYDQIGFGGRVEQTRHFYERNPKWSLMGKMVSDARDAIHALAKIENLDFSKVYLFGYSLGAKIALLTAALDDRVAGVVSICGFAPLRLDTPEKGTEGVRHYSHVHGLMPRLGFFEGHETRLPADWDEVLAAVAPRPVHIIAPTLDRYNPAADVERAVDDAGKVYAMLGDRAALELHTPVNFNRFPEEFQEQAILWLRRRAGLGERRAQKISDVPFPPPSVYTNLLLK
jgi:pimeloyl-ACP methyl ester carboxylesterase